MMRLIYFVEIASVEADHNHQIHIDLIVRQPECQNKMSFTFLCSRYHVLFRMKIHFDHVHVLCLLLLIIYMRKLPTTQGKHLSYHA